MPGLIHRLEVAALLVPLIGCALLVVLASFGIAWQARGRKVR